MKNYTAQKHDEMVDRPSQLARADEKIRSEAEGEA
tara:strand:+ start:488 stop:592 length:105 start_codon:yes stop_codon:yes gene_type:complete